MLFVDDGRRWMRAMIWTLAAFFLFPHETAQACACGNVGKVTVITQDPSLQIVRVTTHEKDLLFVVCFQKKKIRIGDLLEDLICDAAYICDDTDLTAVIINGKSHRFCCIVGNGERPDPEIIDLKILSRRKYSAAAFCYWSFNVLPSLPVGPGEYVGQLFCHDRKTFHVVYVLVSDKDGRHGFKRCARLFQSLKNLFPRDPCIDQDGRTLVFY